MPVTPPPYLTAKAVNAGVLSVLARVDRKERAATLRQIRRHGHPPRHAGIGRVAGSRRFLARTPRAAKLCKCSGARLEMRDSERADACQ